MTTKISCSTKSSGRRNPEREVVCRKRKKTLTKTTTKKKRRVICRLPLHPGNLRCRLQSSTHPMMYQYTVRSAKLRVLIGLFHRVWDGSKSFLGLEKKLRGWYFLRNKITSSELLIHIHNIFFIIVRNQLK